MVSIEKVNIFIGHKLVYFTRKQTISLSFMIYAIGIVLGFLAKSSSKIVSVLAISMCVLCLLSSIKALEHPGTTVYTLFFGGVFSLCISMLLCLGSYEITLLMYNAQPIFLFIQIGLMISSAGVWNWYAIEKITKKPKRKENRVSVTGPLVGVLLALLTSRVIFFYFDELAIGLFVSICLFLGSLISIGGTHNIVKVYFLLSRNLEIPEDGTG